MKGKDLSSVTAQLPHAKIVVQLPNGQFVEAGDFSLDYSTGTPVIVLKPGASFLGTSRFNQRERLNDNKARVSSFLS